MEVGFQVILCNSHLTKIDFALLVCLLEGSDGKLVTGKINPHQKEKEKRRLLCVCCVLPFRQFPVMAGP